MELVGEAVTQTSTDTVRHYAARVRILALTYVTLNLVALTVMALVIWRVQFFITLTQRSNAR